MECPDECKSLDNLRRQLEHSTLNTYPMITTNSGSPSAEVVQGRHKKGNRLFWAGTFCVWDGGSADREQALVRGSYECGYVMHDLHQRVQIS